jgi:hypothetical protein
MAVGRVLSTRWSQIQLQSNLDRAPASVHALQGLVPLGSVLPGYELHIYTLCTAQVVAWVLFSSVSLVSFTPPSTGPLTANSLGRYEWITRALLHY